MDSHEQPRSRRIQAAQRLGLVHQLPWRRFHSAEGSRTDKQWAPEARQQVAEGDDSVDGSRII